MKEIYSYPSTRYSGSKLRLLDWLWGNIKDIEFDSVLDALGGTGSVSLLFKNKGKKVFYNDILKFNQIIAMAIIENDRETVSEDDIEQVLKFDPKRRYPDFIQREYEGIFFTRSENEWLDKIVTQISDVENKYKRAILLAALFQACLAKRPFNLFHRANLYLRTNDVKRSFGNKTTWETPFPVLFRRFVKEYNQAVFSNGRQNKVIGGYNVLESPNGVDLVYLDPPYFSKSSSQGTNYLAFYHFLEGISDYANWSKNSCALYGKTKRIPDFEGIECFTRKSKIYHTFDALIERFRDNIIVLSYQSEGIPTKEQIVDLFKRNGKIVDVFEIPHKYVLSRREKRELLFVAR